MLRHVYRKILRLHEAEQRDSFLHKLDLSLYDLAKVFRLIRQVNGQLSVTTNRLVYQGSVHQGDAIPDAWDNYFGALATPSSSASDQVIENKYQSIKNAVCADDPPTLSEDEVEVAISSLKRNKVAGVDNIDSEHILYGGSLLVRHLSWLFNAILASSYVPKAFKLGQVIPIPKGRIFYKDLSKFLRNLYTCRASCTGFSSITESTSGRF